MTGSRELNQDFLEWCQRNRFHINSSKTKELVVDFRRCKRSPPVPVSIQGLDFEKSYKYLGVHLNNKLDWADHALKRDRQTLSAEETEVLWSTGSTPEGHLLWSGLLEQQHGSG